MKLVAVLVPTLILGATDWWLRTARRVKDPTLWWLWAGLLTWSVAAAIGYQWPAYSEHAAYFLSPLNNIFLIGATFHFSRVRELVGKQRATRLYWFFEAAVIAAGVSSLVLWHLGHIVVAKPLDAGASVITFVLLGGALWVSFYHYAQPLMGVVATAACLAGAVRQVLAAMPGSLVINEPWFVMSGVATNMTLAMTLVALTSAWNFSKSFEFAIVGEPVLVNVMVLFVDMRGSTAWAYKLDNPDRVRRFMNELRKWILGASEQHLGKDHKPELIKFLGDGYLFVWEVPDSIDTERQGVAIALTLEDGYGAFKHRLVEEARIPDDFPVDIGVGLAIGRALRLTSENGLRDYLGTAVNLAAKFQGRTRVNGGVVVADSITSALVDGVKARFEFEDLLAISNVFTVKIRSTRSFA